MNINECTKCTDGFIEIEMDGKWVKVICDWCNGYGEHEDLCK